MTVLNSVLEKWHLCSEARYKSILIIPSSVGLFADETISEISGTTNAQHLDFLLCYKGQLNSFITWQTIRDKIAQHSNSNPILMTNLEPIYSKWKVEERVSFLKNFTRSEPGHPAILILHCTEDLEDLLEIEQNNRGQIWAPKSM